MPGMKAWGTLWNVEEGLNEGVLKFTLYEYG